MFFMKSIPLRNRAKKIVAYTKVDDKDYLKLSKHRWGRDAYGYAVSAFYINKKTVNVKMHRLITDAPKGLDVDHINRDKLDNQRHNLRVCTRSENNINQPARADNSSGIKGVGWDKSRSKWRAQIKIDGKNKCIGRFDNLEDAAKAYAKVARDIYGDYLPKEIYFA